VRTVAQRMHNLIETTVESRPKFSDGGIIVNLPGYDPKEPDAAVTAILTFASAFHINMVCIIGDNTRMSERLSKALSTSNVGCAFVTREFQGIPSLPSTPVDITRRLRSAKVREYFYGAKASLLQCFRVTVPLAEVALLRIDGRNIVRPIDLQTEAPFYHHCVGAVSHATKEEDIVIKNVAGFVVFLGVNFEMGQVELITPSPAGLPKKFILLSSDIRMLTEDVLSAK